MSKWSRKAGRAPHLERSKEVCAESRLHSQEEQTRQSRRNGACSKGGCGARSFSSKSLITVAADHSVLAGLMGNAKGVILVEWLG